MEITVKTLNKKLQKHTLMAALLAIALAGCNGQEAKALEETVAIPKVAESKPAPQPVAKVDKVGEQVNPPETKKPAVIVSTDQTGLVNVARGKVASQSSDYNTGGKSNVSAPLAVDGNVDGNAKNGAITHTAKDANAWLEVDLAEIEKIDHILLWNRTDGGGERLKNYWIFISIKPFSPTDTVEKLRKNKAVIAIKGGVANPSFTTAGAGLGGGDMCACNWMGLRYLPMPT